MPAGYGSDRVITIRRIEPPGPSSVCLRIVVQIGYIDVPKRPPLARRQMRVQVANNEQMGSLFARLPVVSEEEM